MEILNAATPYGKLLKSRAFTEGKRERESFVAPPCPSFRRIFARQVRPRMQIRPMYSVYFNIREREGARVNSSFDFFFFFFFFLKLVSKLLTGFNARRVTDGDCRAVDLIFGWKWPIVRVLKFYPFALEKQLLLLLGKLVSYGKWGRIRQTRFIQRLSRNCRKLSLFYYQGGLIKIVFNTLIKFLWNSFVQFLTEYRQTYYLNLSRSQFPRKSPIEEEEEEEKKDGRSGENWPLQFPIIANAINQTEGGGVKNGG